LREEKKFGPSFLFLNPQNPVIFFQNPFSLLFILNKSAQ